MKRCRAAAVAARRRLRSKRSKSAASLMRIFLHSPEGRARGPARRCRDLRHPRQCAVPAGRPPSLADVRLGRDAAGAAGCRREPAAAPAPGRTDLKAGRGGAAGNQAGRGEGSRSQAHRDQERRSQKRFQERFQEPDPMANLVVKSTGAPAAAPTNVARPPAPIPATGAKRRSAPRGGACSARSPNMATAS